jgi:hypothetical protein
MVSNNISILSTIKCLENYHQFRKSRILAGEEKKESKNPTAVKQYKTKTEQIEGRKTRFSTNEKVNLIGGSQVSSGRTHLNSSEGRTRLSQGILQKARFQGGNEKDISAGGELRLRGGGGGGRTAGGDRDCLVTALANAAMFNLLSYQSFFLSFFHLRGCDLPLYQRHEVT